MPELWLFIQVLVVGVVAGIVNTISGGGTYLMLPLLVFCGLEPKAANATNRFAVAFQAVAGAITMHRQGIVRWRVSLVPTAIAAAGGVVGALVTNRLDPEQFRSIAGWILLLGIGLLFVRPRRIVAPAPMTGASSPPAAGRGLRWGGWAATFLVGIYGGFIGAAVGVVILVFLPRLLGLDMVQGVAVKTLMVFAFSASASAVYLWVGLVDLGAAVPVILGYVVGGVVGAKITIAVGDAWVRRFVGLVGAALAIAMIFGSASK